MTTTKTTKATRATIDFGDQKIEGLQFPDGSYHLFINQLNEELGIKASNSTGKKYVQPLLEANSNQVNSASIEGVKSHLKTLSLDLVSQLIGIYAGLGNERCLAIAIACVAESLERRFDKAFKVKRTEEERNQRLQSRRDGIVSRHFWTDTIEIYIETHEVSDNYKKFIYIHVSDLINNAVLGTTAKKYRENLGLPEGTSTRDYLTTEQLKQIDTLEKAAGLRVVKNDLCPKQALKDIIGLLF